VGAGGLVVIAETFRLQFDSHCRSFASNLEQVANLMCAQATQPPTLSGTGND